MAKIKQLCVGIMEGVYRDQKVYKLLYQLKHRGYIVGLRKDLFFVQKSPDAISLEDIIARYYWVLVKKHATHYVTGRWYVWGLKALELHALQFQPVDEILLVNEGKQCHETIVLDKKVSYKTYTAKGQSLFGRMYRYTQPIKIGTSSMRFACLELALLETLFSPDVVTWTYRYEFVKKMLKKNKKQLDLSVFAAVLGMGKHHTSMNRLADIAGLFDRNLASVLQGVIRKYGYVIS